MVVEPIVNEGKEDETIVIVEGLVDSEVVVELMVNDVVDDESVVVVNVESMGPDDLILIEGNELILLDMIVEALVGLKEVVKLKEVDEINNESVAVKPEDVVELIEVIDELTDAAVEPKEVVKLIVADIVVDEPVVEDEPIIVEIKVELKMDAKLAVTDVVDEVFVVVKIGVMVELEGFVKLAVTDVIVVVVDFEIISEFKVVELIKNDVIDDEVFEPS